MTILIRSNDTSISILNKANRTLQQLLWSLFIIFLKIKESEEYKEQTNKLEQAMVCPGEFHVVFMLIKELTHG